MKKLLLLPVLLLLWVPHANAQFGYGKLKDVQKIREVPLLVVLLESDKKVVKKLSRKNDGRLEEYYTRIEDYNNHLKKAFEDSWIFSKEMKFITSGELKNYQKKANKGKYAYFKQHIDKGDPFSNFDHKGAITTYNYPIYITGKRKPVYSFMYSTESPNEADFRFISQQIQAYLNFREIQKTTSKSRRDLLEEINANAPLLREKTLLLDENDLSKNVLEEIAELYQYPVRITTKEEIDSAIISGDPTKAYLKVVPVGQVSNSQGMLKTSRLLYIQYIINAENGDYLAYINPSALQVPGLMGMLVNDSNRKVKKNDLRHIVAAIERAE